jgi:DNA polymerase-3 subunit delta
MPEVFPVYLFTGDDDYLKRQALHKLKKALLQNGSEAFNFNTYNIGKCNIQEAMNSLRRIPFAAGKRLVFLKHIDKAAKKEQEAIMKYVRNPSKKACLVLESSKRELLGQFYSDIKRHAREISFTIPATTRITDWIQKEVKARGKSIRYDAVHLLKELKKNDINSLRCEIDKLVTFVGERPAISKQDVEELVGSSASRTVFEFVHALSKKDAKQAFVITKDLLRTKKEVSEILGMIGWQFRRIKKAQELLKKGVSKENTSTKFNIPPFYIERFMREIKSFTPKELDKNIDYLLDADYSIKKGYMKPQDALEVLIVNICSEHR